MTPGERRRLVVTAVARSGKETDVTDQCRYKSTDTTVAEFDGTEVEARGEGRCNINFAYTDPRGNTFTLRVGVTVIGNADGVENIVCGDGSDAAYYTTGGLRLNAPRRGVTIRRQGINTKKIMTR